MTVPRTAAIVGVGLIGGSVGLSLRSNGWRVIGVDHDDDRLAAAIQVGAIDGSCALDDLAPCDLAVVATPVGDVAGIARELLARGVAVVTDVGSVKAPIVNAVDNPQFVGGHPMAGSEQDGLEGATADLFRGTTWVLTPTPTTHDTAFASVSEVVSATGAQVIAMPPDRHDMLVAIVSHVPHLTAATLMRLADSRADEHRILLRLAAGGFRDMTRIAAGSPTIWPDICTQNSEAIVEVLDELLDRLQVVREVVAASNHEMLVQQLESARTARRNLPTTAPIPAAMSEMRVPVLDRQGELAAVASLAAELDVNIYDLEIAHSAEGPRGVIVLLIETDRVERLQGGLMALGYRPSLRALET